MAGVTGQVLHRTHGVPAGAYVTGDQASGFILHLRQSSPMRVGTQPAGGGPAIMRFMSIVNGAAAPALRPQPLLGPHDHGGVLIALCFLFKALSTPWMQVCGHLGSCYPGISSAEVEVGLILMVLTEQRVLENWHYTRTWQN